MTTDALLRLGVVLLIVVVVLVAAVLVIMARMPRLLVRLRRPPVEPTQRPAEQVSKKQTAMEKASLEKARAEVEGIKLEAERLRIQAREVLAVQTDALGRQREELDQKASELSTREDELNRSRRAAVEHEAKLVGQQDEVLRRLETLSKRELDVERRAQDLARTEATARATLEQLAGLTAEEARQALMARVEHEAKLSAAALAREIETAAVRDAEARARRTIVESIQRLASEQTSESVVTTVPLPSEDLKGRIIGREGRNIRAFEQITGVNLMIDDTPEAVLLSCFDPVRRETARITLVELIRDGRIQPARIEEAYERSLATVEERCLRAGQEALVEMKITDLAPALVPIVGALQYRTSYGQNVLKHLIECGHLAAMMAAELGLDVDTCRRAAFLHDIGKALTHEAGGSHAIVGAELLRRHGEHADIAHAVEAHHNEVEPRTVEAVLTQAADAISGSRPGARRESLEAYVQRLERLEEIAGDRDGVDRVFAMQAGREIRVMVSPEAVSDADAQFLARDIAKQVEAELTYPGTIKITVVRESRATELAH
ncbi:ribonuclease Y [Propioniciclava tarda]|uniref:Ribonuclease Y n=1 Tax=Propioniciclava tarda TaxID=433330 RepID=A0A4Q9KNB5_PROTD|nr:ribonuclease Y [Propioniciclava tarda]TBT96048.1 ribonuclease Y [Propioniciclava tarda]SMO43740.1 ribonucrease Y [Propioniciclava tarda]HQA30523.1 ribonuclease Y [Propioniciclava tarda]